MWVNILVGIVGGSFIGMGIRRQVNEFIIIGGFIVIIGAIV